MAKARISRTLSTSEDEDKPNTDNDKTRRISLDEDNLAKILNQLKKIDDLQEEVRESKIIMECLSLQNDDSSLQETMERITKHQKIHLRNCGFEMLLGEKCGENVQRRLLARHGKAECAEPRASAESHRGESPVKSQNPLFDLKCGLKEKSEDHLALMATLVATQKQQLIALEKLATRQKQKLSTLAAGQKQLIEAFETVEAKHKQQLMALEKKLISSKELAMRQTQKLSTLAARLEEERETMEVGNKQQLAALETITDRQQQQQKDLETLTNINQQQLVASETEKIKQYQRLKDLETLTGSQKQQLLVLETQSAEHKKQLENYLNRPLSCQASFIWKVDNWSEKLNEAKKSDNKYYYSPPYYTGNCGYKFQMRIYPNGTGAEINTHISLFFKILYGEYDAILTWPFPYKVTLRLLEQGFKKSLKHIETWLPYQDHEYRKRPSKANKNVEYGFYSFVSHQTLNERLYLEDDAIFIQIEIEPEQKS